MGFVRRRTRRRAMLVAGGAAYAYGKSRGQEQAGDEGGYEEQGYEEPPPAPPPPAPTSGDSGIDELQQLADLHASGALTDDEFAAAKAKVIGT